MLHQRRIIRITERTVSPMMEMRVKEVMEHVERDIRKTPGLQRIETLVDRNDPNRHFVITEWASRQHLNVWLNSELCKRTIKQLETVLQKTVVAREFVHHEDDVFLL